MELFKYLIPERIDILRHSNIRFTQPSDFNDPWESLPRLDALFKPEATCKLVNEVFLSGRQGNYEKMLECQIAKFEATHGISLTPEQKELTYKEFRKSFLPTMEEQLSNFADVTLGLKTAELQDLFIKTTFEKLDAIITILCLSEVPDNLLMWSHYAASHKGFVIGFDPTHNFFDQRITEFDIIRKLKPVKYTKKRPGFEGFSGDFNESEVLKLADMMLLTKSIAWEYEHEWRMMRLREAADCSLGTPPSVFLYNIPPECMTSVIIGCRTAEFTRCAILEQLARKEYLHIRVLRAEQDRTDYKLNIVKA